MKYVTPRFEQQLQELAEILVQPERFAAQAVAEVVQLRLAPEPIPPQAA